MKKWISFTLLFGVVACTRPAEKQPKNDHANSAGATEKPVSSEKKETAQKVFLVSTYDDPKYKGQSADHREKLQQLSDSGVFQKIHNTLFTALDQNQQNYFRSKPEYFILSDSKGDLFLNKKSDRAFVVYDSQNGRFTILVYNQLKNTYAQLYREIPVENGLEHANCNYSMFGTLDYILANEFLYQEDYLLKNPLGYLESPVCRIGNMKHDPDLVLKEGCYAKKVVRSALPQVLSITMSSIYNDWECLSYDPETHSFCIVFGQAFAD